MLDVVLIAIAVAVLVPLAVLAVECLAALLPARRSPDGPRPGCAVLVPAHDEEAGLGETLAALRPQLEPGDRLLVIADNCTDRTAAVARNAGAEVLERFDPDHRGKAFALAAGGDALRAGPPDVVVVVDADCRLGPDTIDRLVRTAAVTGRPVQGAYAHDPPPAAGPRDRVSAWSVRFKNIVRPLGLRRLGLPCLVTGSGVAFPWRILRNVPLANRAMAEDFRLAVDLAVAGHPPLFEPFAEVTTNLPAARAAARGQRRRWEHGHIGLLFTQVPRLWWEAVRQRRWDLAGLALELGVPPLSALGMGWCAALVAALILADSWLPAGLLLVGGAVTAAAALVAWGAFGRDVLPPAALFAVPAYAVAKIPLYVAFLCRRQRVWLRTPRDPQPVTPSPRSELR
jgi:hypothetical protein